MKTPHWLLLTGLILNFLLIIPANAQIFFGDGSTSKTLTVYMNENNVIFDSDNKINDNKSELSFMCSDPNDNLTGSYRFQAEDPNELPGLIFDQASIFFQLSCDDTGKTIELEISGDDFLHNALYGSNGSDEVTMNIKVAHTGPREDPGFQLLDLTLIVKRCSDDDDDDPKDEDPVTPPPEVECKAEFTTNGLQPVGATFQDDRGFKNHTILSGEEFSELGGFIIYTVTENDAKDLVNNRSTLVMARNPSYIAIDDLTKITFSGTSNYTRDVPLELKISASDAAGVVMRYTHKQKMKGPFGGPCGPESSPFSITFELSKLLARNPKPPAFKFQTPGLGEVKASVFKAGSSEAIMSTATDFNISNTTMGTIGILPVGNPTAPNVAGITSKLRRDARRLGRSISRTTPDFLPLPSERIEIKELPFAIYRPIDVSSANTDEQAAQIFQTNFTNLYNLISQSSQEAKANGEIDVLVTVLDTDSFSQVDSRQPAAFAFTGSIDAPGDVFVQSSSIRSRFSGAIVNQRTESAIHEIAHSYGFVGEEDTTCPPDIHNVGSSFSDSCRITRGTVVRSVCKLLQPHIMGPAVPSSMITQCTYEDLVDRFKNIAVSQNNNLRNLTSQSGSESLQILASVSTDGTNADFLNFYDSSIEANSFLENATSSSWHFDLKNTAGSSIQKLHFEFDPANLLEELSLDTVILDRKIPLDGDIASIELVNPSGNTIATKAITDVIPSIQITNASLTKGNGKQGSELTVEWSVNDSSGQETLVTVFIGSKPDELVVHGDGLEVSGTSVTLTGIAPKPKIKYVQLKVTNGSRSSKSEVFEL